MRFSAFGEQPLSYPLMNNAIHPGPRMVYPQQWIPFPSTWISCISSVYADTDTEK